MLRHTLTTLLGLGTLVASMVTSSAACDCAGEQHPPPPTGLPPGAELDDSIVELADTLRPEPDYPPELLSSTIQNALVMTGFGVRDPDSGIIFQPDDEHQGVVFESWDVDTMALGLTSGIAIPFDDYVDAWAEIVGGNQAELRAALIDDLAAAAASDNWLQSDYAQLIIALGRNSAAGYDLLDPNVDGQAPLDALQLGLLTFRLTAELAQALQGGSDSQTSQGLDSLPCTQTGAQGVISDAGAVGSGLVWGHVLDKIAEEHGLQSVENLSNGMAAANAALVYVKLAWSLAVFRVDMSVTPQPLERLQNGSPGRRATITATFQLDGTGKLQLVNCLRSALNAANFDFSLPEDGPLVGKRVVWEIEAKGDDDVLQTVGDDVLDDTTSDTGTAELDVDGKPRRDPIDPTKRIVDVERHPRVRATTNLKNKDFWQDMVDVSAGLGGLGALATLPAEILNRKPLLFTGAKTVIVNDKKELLGNRFRIEGDYASVFGDGGLAKNVADHFVAEIEAKALESGELKITLLTWADEATSYVDGYEATGPNGEGCIQTTTVNGTFEVYTSRHRPTFAGFFSPAVPQVGLKETWMVSVVDSGTSRHRGFVTTNDDPSCPDASGEAGAADVTLGFSFDSTKFETSGVFHDSTSDGWNWTVTFIE